MSKDWEGQMIGKAKWLGRPNDWEGQMIGKAKRLGRPNDWEGQMIGKAIWFKSLWEQVNTKGPNYKQDSENGLRLHMSGERLI